MPQIELTINATSKDGIAFRYSPEFNEEKTGKLFDLLRKIGDAESKEDRIKLARRIIELIDNGQADKNAVSEDGTPFLFLAAHVGTPGIVKKLLAHSDIASSVRIGNPQADGTRDGVLEYLARRQPLKDVGDATEPVTLGHNGASDRLKIYRLLLQDPRVSVRGNLVDLFPGAAKKTARFKKAISAWIRNRQAIIALGDKETILAALQSAITEVTDAYPKCDATALTAQVQQRLGGNDTLVRKMTGRLPTAKGIRLKRLDPVGLQAATANNNEKVDSQRAVAWAIWKKVRFETTDRTDLTKNEKRDSRRIGQATILQQLPHIN